MNLKFAIVGGIKTCCLSRKELVSFIKKRIKSRCDIPFSISSTNGHSISLYNSDEFTKKVIDSTDLMHADGQSVVWMSKWLCKNKIAERSATTDMFLDISEYDESETKHFLLGGKREIVEKCGQIMASRYPNFKLSGTQDGYFTKSQERAVIDKINSSGAEILWVGLGKPREQIFVYENLSELHVPVIITCGGCYNFVTGDYQRAPAFMQKFGLEWLYRVFKEPRKLFWRYFSTNPHSIWCAIKGSK